MKQSFCENMSLEKQSMVLEVVPRNMKSGIEAKKRVSQGEGAEN